MQDIVDWERLWSWRPPSWVLGVVGASTAAYLIYKTIKITRTDCDLTLMSKSLKPSYFTGRVVWVTGASSGIGEALCHELSKHNALLIMSARSEEKMENIRQSLRHPENTKILPLDLSDTNICIAATNKALKLFGKIDILINNAGVGQRCFFMDTDEATDDILIQTNYKAPRTLTRGVIPGMLAQDFGHVVNISSICGLSGMPLMSSYCASKFALQGLTHSMHYEFYDKKNLHFTLVCPGPVRTSIGYSAQAGGGNIYGKSSSSLKPSMSPQRCAELTLIAISNQLLEAWVAPQPSLCVPYRAHYAPSWLHSHWRNKAGRFMTSVVGRNSY